ncbi:hypothetical protein ACFLSJ_08125 [Verrucomicrobiota bacterium]
MNLHLLFRRRLLCLLLVGVLTGKVTVVTGAGSDERSGHVGGSKSFLLNYGTSGPFLMDDQCQAPLVGAFLDEDPPDFVPPFYGHATAGLIQLVHDAGRDGPDGPPDISQADGVIVGGNDLVVGSSWVGYGMWGSDPDPLFGQNDATRNGQFAAALGVDMALAVGDRFYIRVFDTPSPDWDNGRIPTTGRYADVAAESFALTQGEIDAGFNLGFLVSAALCVSTPVATATSTVPTTTGVTTTVTTTGGTTTTCVCAGLWGDGADLGGGWYWIEWFGFFADTGCPTCFVWHMELGWLFSYGTSADSIWFWSEVPELEWLWTADATFPYMYRAVDGAWLWYLEGTTGPAWFLNLSTGAWETY